MSEKKHTLQPRMGEPLPEAHLRRLIDATKAHGQRVVKTKVIYPDPAALTESDLFDPRTETASSTDEGANADAGTDLARDEPRTKGDSNE